MKAAAANYWRSGSKIAQYQDGERVAAKGMEYVLGARRDSQAIVSTKWSPNGAASYLPTQQTRPLWVVARLKNRRIYLVAPVQPRLGPFLSNAPPANEHSRRRSFPAILPNHPELAADLQAVPCHKSNSTLYPSCGSSLSEQPNE